MMVLHIREPPMDQPPPADLSENPTVTLPSAAQLIGEHHPNVWAAFQQLGAAVSNAGPLDGRTKRLVHLALAIGANSRGAVHSHTRRGLAEGLGPAALEQAEVLSARGVR